MSRPFLGADDPGGLAHRRAARIVVVGVVVFVGLGWVLDLPEAAGPAFFAVFTLGAQADFGGTPRRRALRYLLTGAVAAAMLLLAAAIQDSATLTVAVTAVVVFATLFLGTLGGPFYPARFPVVIAFLYGATTHATGTVLADRMLGWGVGTVGITLGALVLWPARDLSEVPGLVGEVLRRAAAMLRGSTPPDARDRLLDNSRRLRVAANREHLHPGAVAPDERRRAELVHAAERLAATCAVATPRASDPADVTLAETAADALHACADAASRRDGDAAPGSPHAPALQDALDRQAQAMADALVGPHTATEAPDVVRAGMTSTDVRIAARVALAVVTLVDEQHGAPSGTSTPAPDEVGDRPDTALRAQFRLRSLWFRNSLRAAVALAIAVSLVLHGVGGDHGFWVALGAFSVLRADLATIGKSGWSTVLGTTIGFAVSSAIVLISDDWHGILWVAYVLGLVGAGLGDRLRPEVASAAFTMLLVTVYTLIQPAGLRTGELRLVNVAIGVTITLGVTLVLWPRPGRAPRRLVAGVVDDARGALAAVLAGSRDVDPRTVIGSLDRVLDVVTTSAPRTLSDHTRARVLVTVDMTATMADFLLDPDTTVSVPLDAVLTAPDLRSALEADGGRVDAALARLSDRLDSGLAAGLDRTPEAPTPPPPAALVAAVEDALTTGEPGGTAVVSAGLRCASGFVLVHRLACEVRAPRRLRRPARSDAGDSGDPAGAAAQPTRTGTFE